MDTSPSQFFSPESRVKLLGDKRWGYLDYQYMHQVIHQDKLGNDHVISQCYTVTIPHPRTV